MTEASDLDPKTVRRGLGIILGVTLVLALAFHLGPRYGDHFLYVQHAAELLRGEFRPGQTQHTQRLGLIVPMAAFQAVFGSWGLASTAFTLVCSLAHVAGAFALGRAFGGARAGLAAAAILSALPLEIINGSTPFPDLLGAALGTWALVLVHRESEAASPRPGLLWAAGSLLAWGYFVKETILFHLALIGLWALLERRWRWAWVAVPFVLGLVLEAAVLGAFAGDPFLRFSTARAIGPALFGQWYPTTGGLTARILWQIPSLLFNPLAKDFPYLAGLAWAFVAAIPRLRRHPGGRKLLVGAAVLLAQIWFWPCSLSPYVPALLAEGRHLFPVCALLAVGAATLWTAAPTRRQVLLASGWTAACLVCTTGIYVYLSREDAGLREAHRYLAAQGVASVRALDVWGHEPGQLRYLNGPKGRMAIRDYRVEDLAGIRGEHVIVDDRSRVLSSAGTPVATGRSLAVPERWTLVWEGRFPGRWDPRVLLLGRPSGAGDYRVRIFQAP